jgi:predicted butyrate kinase (DUF1464 family)
MSTNPRSTALFCEFVSDPTNDGTYILNLNAEETKFFFEKIHQIERDLINANAALIVRAVNSHTALVAALEDALDVIRLMGCDMSNFKQAREALALARGNQ